MLICQLTDLHVRPAGFAANRVSETNMLTERALRVVASSSISFWRIESRKTDYELPRM